MPRVEANVMEASCRGRVALGKPRGGSWDRGLPASLRGIADSESGDVAVTTL